MKSAIRVLIIASVVFIFATSAFAGKVSSKLTADELAKVKAGEIVLKNDLSEKTQSGSGIAFGTFKVSKEEFWKVIYDYPNYKDIFPRIEYAKIIEKNDDQFLTDFAMDATLATLKYTSWNRPSKDGNRLDFGLVKDRPHKYFKEMNGYWQLEELEGGLILAEYKVNVELDVPVIGKMLTKIVNSMAGKDLPTVLKAVRKRAESGGTWKLSDGV